MVEESLQHEVETLRRLLALSTARGIGIAGGSNIPGYPSPAPSNIPIPDPSVATQREIDTLRVEFRQEFKDLLSAQNELLRATGVARHEKAMVRIDGIEKAQQTFDDNLNRVPTALDRESHRMEQLFREKLRTVETEIKSFQEFGEKLRSIVNKHTDDVRANAKEAITTAFASAKELSNGQRDSFKDQITKSEASTNQEIIGIKALISARDEKTSADIQNLNSRLDRGDGGAAGAKQTIDNSRAGTNTTAVVVSACIAGASLLLFLASSHFSPSSNPTGGADTKRVDDLISQTQEQNRTINSRLDALSGRMSAFVAAQGSQPQLQTPNRNP
jgi:hypothetical protein